MGEWGWRATELPRGVAGAVAAGLRAARIEGLEDAVASYESVGLTFGALPPSEGAVREAIEMALRAPKSPPREHEIPVCYELGPDLVEAAERLRLTAHEVSRLHVGQTYECYAVGFCPGFAYLGDLPAALQGLPRLASPRKRVEAGSIGITGNQTAAYPLETPGGWWLIGRTPLTLVCVEENYFPIEAGDLVRFVQIDEAQFEDLKGERL